MSLGHTKFYTLIRVTCKPRVLDTYLGILNEKNIEPQLTAPTGYSLDFHGHFVTQFKSVPMKSVVITPPEI